MEWESNEHVQTLAEAIRNDSDLEALRADPRFPAILAEADRAIEGLK